MERIITFGVPLYLNMDRHLSKSELTSVSYLTATMLPVWRLATGYWLLATGHYYIWVDVAQGKCPSFSTQGFLRVDLDTSDEILLASKISWLLNDLPFSPCCFFLIMPCELE